MRIDYSHPVIVTGVPPRCRTPRSVVCLVHGSCDIPEVDAADFPVACVFRMADGKPRTVRHHEGRFFEEVCQAGMVTDVNSGRFATKTGLERLMIRDITRTWVSGQYTLPAIWPSSCVERCGGGNLAPGRPEGLRAEAKLPEGLVHVSEVRDAPPEEIDRWMAKGDAIVSAMVVLDGAIWRVVPEPMVAYRRNRDAWFVDADVYDVDLTAWYMPRPFGSNARQESAFYWQACLYAPMTMAAGFIDEYAKWAEGLSVGRRYGAEISLSMLGSIEVRMPDVFGNGWAAREVSRTARLMVKQAFERFRPREHNYRWEKDAPKAMRTASDALEEHLSSGGDLGDEMEGVVTDMLAAADGIPESSFHSGFMDATCVDMKWLLEHWRARPISAMPPVSVHRPA